VTCPTGTLPGHAPQAELAEAVRRLLEQFAETGELTIAVRVGLLRLDVPVTKGNELAALV